MIGAAVGDMLPDATLEGAEGPIGLRDLIGAGPLLILFFEEALTPSCTTQLSAFRDEFGTLEELGASVAAISADDLTSLAHFQEAEALPFPLLSDPELRAAAAFGVADWAAKRSRRAAFVADAQGVLTLAIPFYQPFNIGHFQSVFAALGLNLPSA